MPYQELVPIAEEDPSWNILLYLIKQNLSGATVTISTLASAASIPYATAMRRIHELIGEGFIVKKPASDTGKSFTLAPSPELIKSFEQYARRIKSLLAETFGLRSKPEDEEGFHGGSHSADHPASTSHREPVPRQAGTALSAQLRQLLRVNGEHVGGFPQQHVLTQELRIAEAARTARPDDCQCGAP